jgi:hypothetical protein
MKPVNLLRLWAKTPLSVPPKGQVDFKVDPSTGLLAQQNSDGTFTALGESFDPSGDFVDSDATSYSLTSANNGQVINFTSGSAVTVTVPTGLPEGFNCGLIQSGAGTVTVAGSGVTVNSVGGLLSLSAQHATASIIRKPTGSFNLSGSLA